MKKRFPPLSFITPCMLCARCSLGSSHTTLASQEPASCGAYYASTDTRSITGKFEGADPTFMARISTISSQPQCLRNSATAECDRVRTTTVQRTACLVNDRAMPPSHYVVMLSIVVVICAELHVRRGPTRFRFWDVIRSSPRRWHRTFVILTCARVHTHGPALLLTCSLSFLNGLHSTSRLCT